MKYQNTKNWINGLIALAVASLIFLLPFTFIFLTAAKPAQEAMLLRLSTPSHWMLVQNFRDVVKYDDFLLLRAFKNSILLTVFAVAILVVLASMVAWVIDRRPGPISKIANMLILSGLMMPPAVVPTIFLLQNLHLFGTFPSMVLIEVAFNTSFTVMIFRGFIASIPKELDEAARIDGANSVQLFFRVVFPLLRSVTITAIILNSVFIFNDFVNPLYFLNGPGTETVQLTLFYFNSQFTQNYALLFMDILIITVPMVTLFAIFNRRIVAGMTAGAVKG